MDMTMLGYLGAALLVLVGLAGVVLPALPGLPLMLAGFVLAAWLDQFQHAGTITLVILSALTAVGMAADFVAGLLGAKAFGASRQALWGAFAGSVIGLFLGLPGLILGPLVGASVGEFIARRDALQAGKVGVATFVGFLIGTAAKVGCALAMLLVFGGAWLFS